MTMMCNKIKLEKHEEGKVGFKIERNADAPHAHGATINEIRIVIAQVCY